MALLLALSGCSAIKPQRSRTPKPTRQSLQVGNRLFIESVAPLAQDGQREFGVPASVTLGQAILESGWGRSGLSVYGGAYFGIKCTKQRSRLQSGCVSQESLEYYDPAKPVNEVSSFRTYRSAADSFRDHGAFLRQHKRYASAFETTDPREFMTRVGKAGYATDPTYAQTVISLIDTYDLTRFDLPADGSTPTPAPRAAEAKVTGAIGAKWRELGAENSPLGEPIGGEVDGPAGQTLVVFERGVILWSKEHGAHPLTGPAWELYRKDPELRLRLGVLLEDPAGENGQTSYRFAGGRLETRDGRATARSAG